MISLEAVKYVTLVFFLLTVKCYAQTYVAYQIRDKATEAAIPNARVVHQNKLLYANDDGNVLVPNTLDSFEVSATGYQTEVFFTASATIRLTPAYQNIPEINFVGVDVKKVFENTLQHYKTRYYAQPSLYRGTLKQKGYMDGELINLVVADINLWSRFNFFNFKAAANFDSFVQIGLDQIKYAKSSKGKTDYPFNTDVQLIPTDFVRTIFLNNQLTAILASTKDNSIRGKVIENGADLRYISFEAPENSIEGTQVSGHFSYHIRDSVITNLELSVKQKNNTRNEKNKKGEEYNLETTNFNVVFDFYKNGAHYLPAQIQVSGSGSGEYKGKEIPFSFTQILSLTDFQPTTTKGLKRKINLNKNLVDNIPSKERNKMNELLLSKEEQQFIDEK